LTNFFNLKIYCGRGVKPAQNGNWYVYDPNYVTGCLEVSTADLLITIEKAIGKIVSVVPAAKNTSIPELQITDPNSFIEHGGLIALYRSNHPNEILSKLSSGHPYTKKALDGLLLRDLSGRPAWLIGLTCNNEDIKAFAQLLRQQFMSINKDAVTQLTNSLEALSPKQKGECITNIIQASQSCSEADSRLICAIRKPLELKHYKQALKTWDKTTESATSVVQYCQYCLSGPQKHLIELDSTQQVDTLSTELERLAILTSRPVFCIDTPDDLICAAPWIESSPSDNSGTLHKGPGGPLYTFLQKNWDKNPLLIVNYERFNADEIVRFNGLLDKEPHADGVPLPKHTQIIGLVNRNKPDCYQGSDFYSRFDSTKCCPLTPQQFENVLPPPTFEVSKQDISDVTTINLYHSHDWKNRLLGCWVVNGDKLTFSEGELITAIKAQKPIVIQNGIWGDPGFERFWKQALTSEVRHAGRSFHIPQGIKLIRPEQDQYEWPYPPIISEQPSDGTENILNPGCLAGFLGRYELEGNKLIKKPGLIEQHKDGELSVYMTSTLPDDSWAMLLDECYRQQVRLKVHAAPGVLFPEGINGPATPAAEARPFQVDITYGLITSTDIDTSVAMLKAHNPSYTVIDVSECGPSDLLTKWDGKLNEETLEFEFSQSDSALVTALDKKENIILKGYFSPELMDALAPLLLKQEGQSHLILITDDATIGAFIPQRYVHQVSAQEKSRCLESVDDELQAYLDQPLSKLEARCMALKRNSTTSDNAWLGMKSLSGPTQASTAMLDITTSGDECAAFNQARLAQVNAVLDSQPYVFLTGLTGVGKSTFVETELCKDDALFLTEDSIEKWAMDSSDKRKVLFLDEANLSPRQWSEFEGLYQQPPHVLVNGKLHILSPHHKVVFAGNPVNYGDERTLAAFFERHGNAVLFTPLPPAVIYEKILKPVFEGVNIDIEPIVQRILDVYRFVCGCSSSEILISPRELQMMALMTIAKAGKDPQNIQAFVEHFSYSLARNLIPKTMRTGFDAKFAPKNPIQMAPDANPNTTFFVTESRRELSQQIDDILQMREWRRSETTLNTAQKAGGLGGLIIEGPPGIGKSELVISALITRGYQQEHDFSRPSQKQNLFYRMPITMGLNEKRAFLLKAFHEGAVVVIDEMNSSPMMERLLNDLLMGKTPEGQAEAPVKPGFMIIATQNPVTMAGRRAASTAIRRRCITHDLPEYKPEEIQHTLVSKGIPPNEAQAMTEAYEKNRIYAIKNQLSPVPNFRHLIHLAEQIQKTNALVNEDTPEVSKFSLFSPSSSDTTAAKLNRNP
jgi:MoxR-like ATPase